MVDEYDITHVTGPDFTKLFPKRGWAVLTPKEDNEDDYCVVLEYTAAVRSKTHGVLFENTFEYGEGETFRNTFRVFQQGGQWKLGNARESLYGIDEGCNWDLEIYSLKDCGYVL